MVNLAIDIGNTRAKFGYYKDREMVDYFVLDQWDADKIYSRLTKESKVIVSKTAVDYDLELDLMATTFDMITLSHETPLPIRLNYLTPETLGRDRIAGSVGAYMMHPGETSVIIDAGTCITYDVVDADGVYQGGQICPGLWMRLAAMHHFTDKLPSVEVKEHKTIGRSTEECLISGAVLGAINEMKGFLEGYNTAFGKINKCITGGDAQIFVLNMKTEIFVVPHLVLQGLNEILLFNEKHH